MSTLPRISSLPERPHVRVLSLSAPVANWCPRRFERGLEWLSGWADVSVGAHARNRVDHLVAEPEQRAEDLVAAWFDPEVDLILSTIGGTTTAQILEHLPLQRMAEQPKLVLGYSDTTSLLAALYAVGVPSIYGPALMPQFAEFGGPHPYTLDALRRVLSGAAGELPVCSVQIDETTPWDSEDDRPRGQVPAEGRRALIPGEVTAPIFACNLGTLFTVFGTPWFPDLRGHILLIEEDEGESPSSMERHFTQLRTSGVLDGLAGLVVGRLHAKVGMPLDVAERSVRRMLRGYDLPCALGLEVSHVDPMHAIPNGVEAWLSVGDEVRLELVGSWFG